MQIFIDGNARYELQSSHETIFEALEEIINHLESNGRAIQGVGLDGETVSPDRLAEVLGDRRIENTNRLEIRSASLGDLVLSSLAEMTEVLPELTVACHSMAEVIAETSIVEAAKSFAQLVDIWTAIKERQAQIVRSLRLEMESLLVDGQSLAAREETLKVTLDKITSALADNDAVAVVDVVTYELVPCADVEIDINEELLARATDLVKKTD